MALALIPFKTKYENKPTGDNPMEVRKPKNTLSAFNGDAGLKAALVARAKQHRLADEYVKGVYEDEWWDENATTFKGCSLGCTVHDMNQERGLSGDFDDHAFLAEQLQLPEFLTHLQDRLFEGLAINLSHHWTERLLTAIPVGADLTPVLPVFLLSLLDGLPPQEGEVKATIEGVKQVLIRWRETGQADKEAAAEAAGAAARAAEKVAEASAMALAGTVARVATWSSAVRAVATAIARIVEVAEVMKAIKVVDAAQAVANATRAPSRIAWEGIADKLILSIFDL